MIDYIPNTMGIKEKTDLENAKMAVAQLDEVSLSAIVELAEIAASNMEAIIELADMVAAIVSENT